MKQKPIHAALQSYLDGQVILINKPLGWTSFDVIKRIRIITKISKVGHAGTLDPLASGLLIICTGKFTKKINEYMGMEKEYTGSFTLGATTASFDKEKQPENFKDIFHLSEENIRAATKVFTGEIMQMPPQFSAIKKNGERMYISARKGEYVKIEPRKVTVSEFEITKIKLPEIYFKIVCSTGTYIRSIANDFGAALNVGAYLSSLERTRIGNFELKDALTPDEFEQKILNLKAVSER